jgi:hypothetical protein
LKYILLETLLVPRIFEKGCLNHMTHNHHHRKLSAFSHKNLYTSLQLLYLKWVLTIKNSDAFPDITGCTNVGKSIPEHTGQQWEGNKQYNNLDESPGKYAE